MRASSAGVAPQVMRLTSAASRAGSAGGWPARRPPAAAAGGARHGRMRRCKMGMDGHQERARDQAYDAIIARTFPFRRDLKRTETDGCRRAGRARQGCPADALSLYQAGPLPIYPRRPPMMSLTPPPHAQGADHARNDRTPGGHAGQGYGQHAAALRWARPTPSRTATATPKGICAWRWNSIPTIRWPGSGWARPAWGRATSARGLGVRPGSAARGDQQVVKELQVFMKRLDKQA